MEKTQALSLLIRHSYLLTEPAKLKLLGYLPKMTPEETDQIGYLLATEKKLSLETAAARTAKLNDLVNKLV